ncbi:MAG: tail fiber domain-containing protein [Tannerella sp.]|nr:tail fiber domain-containing protein [Tannerella sp.]
MGIEEWESGLNFWVPWPNPNNGNYKMFIDQNGRVGIGRKLTTYKLEIGGDLFIDGHLLQSSDMRLKDNIQDISKTNLLNEVNNISGKVYNKKSTLGFEPENEVQMLVKYGKIKPEEADKTLQSLKQQERNNLNYTEFGFLAQELQIHFPELVHEGNDGYLSVNYIELIPILVESIKELKQIVDDQNSELETILSNYPINN